MHPFLCSVGRCLAWCTHGSHVTPVHTRTLRRRSATCNWPFVGGTLAVRQVADSLLHLTTEGASSNVGPETVCRQLGLLWASWVSPDKCWNSKPSWVTAACSHVLSDSLSIDHSTIRRYRIWATGSVINSVTNPGLLWASWVSPDKFWNSKPSWVTAACPHVLSDSLSIDHSTIRRYGIWAADSDINSVTNPVYQWSRGSVLAFSTPVRGFKPGRSRRIFKGEKNPQHAFLRRGSKAVGPMS